MLSCIALWIVLLIVADIHCGALLTKVDRVHPQNKDMDHVFRDEDLGEQVEMLAGQLNLAKDDILPIINYTAHDESDETRNHNSKCPVTDHGGSRRTVVAIWTAGQHREIDPVPET